MAVLPADHVIEDTRPFQRVLGDAFDLAQRSDVIVTIGIQPTEPATGYGYIRVGEPLPPAPGKKTARTAFYRAEKFVEKPDPDRALEYLKSGRYRWNAGMFVWSFATVSAGLRRHQPRLHEAAERWRAAAAAPARLRRVLAGDYPALEKISVDYALMEHAENVVVADGTFPWDDLGSWTALGRHLEADAAGNCAVGEFVQVDAARNIIFDARTGARRAPIAVVGLQDVILVQTDDATLLAHQSRAQDVKALVQKLAADPRFKRIV
jgi:mannose-1-phosphate guanylyltransferase